MRSAKQVNYQVAWASESVALQPPSFEPLWLYLWPELNGCVYEGTSRLNKKTIPPKAYNDRKHA